MYEVIEKSFKTYNPKARDERLDEIARKWGAKEVTPETHAELTSVAMDNINTDIELLMIRQNMIITQGVEL